ncbi:MAG: hypothetical protein O2791_06275, partial [Bacteroidetes bacterium]|nr:hypothetical protein [Bacteroidota bacterium]
MTDQHQPTRPAQDSDEITLKDLWNTIQGLMSQWPLIVGCAVLGCCVAYLINRYTLDRFEVSATVAVEETQNPLASVDGMLDLGFGFGGYGIVDTRVAVLKSYAHNLRV